MRRHRQFRAGFNPGPRPAPLLGIFIYIAIMATAAWLAWSWINRGH